MKSKTVRKHRDHAIMPNTTPFLPSRSSDRPMDQTGKTNRRKFLATAIVSVAGATTALGTSTLTAVASPLASSSTRAKEKIPLGFDNFSIRAWNWKAERLIDFAAEQNLDSLLMSDLDVYENHSTSYLQTLKKKAEDQGILLHAGTGGICPTAGRFIKKWGSAEEHLKLGIRIAQTIGSPVFRCYLGGVKDRSSEGGIQSHIDNTVKVLKSVEKLAVDANVKIAVENHAGDMQAWELVGLIEEAGKHFVGATLDSGNATWTLETPSSNLESLGPFAVSSGIRDSTIWTTEKGASVAWNAVGEGQVDWNSYAKRFGELCPNVPFQLEIISGFNKSFPYKEANFWKAYPDAKAVDFSKFLNMANTGKAIPTANANDKDFQMAELKRSIKYCKKNLGMGRKSD